MEQWLESLTAYPPFLLYGFFALASVAENLLPMLPGDMVTVFGGYLAGRGMLSPWWVFVATAAGNWAGFMLIFLAGRWVGHTRIHAVLRGWFPHGGLDKVEGWFKHYGGWVILANRFLAGTRSVVSLFAGFSDMRKRLVGLLAAISAAAWCALLVWAGASIGGDWTKIQELMDTYNRLFWGLLLLLLALYWLWRLARRLRRRRG